MTFKTEAIVLRHQILKGPDRIYDILTPREGKLATVARGAARSISRMAGCLLPFSYVKLMIGRGQHDYLAGVRTIESFQALRESWFNFILASSLVELILVVNVPGQAARDEFNLLNTAFALISSSGYTNQQKVLIARVFLWKMFTLSGWKPNISSCAVCRTTLQSDQTFYQSPLGFVCDLHNRNGIVVPNKLRQYVRNIAESNEWKRFIREGANTEIQQSWFELTQQYYQDIITVPLRSIKFLQYV